jgi:hypothetical protein
VIFNAACKLHDDRVISQAEVYETIVRLNFGVHVFKAAGWLSSARYSLGSFTFSPYNIDDKH